ncbi:MAG: LuxR C-terminal-related transcriptional regulator [Bacteroidales bacterium]|jgi:DNA-binding NarL/FixJ family response regulator|nr:LuxR C-terminal-related transcriptional regulator [Bacteroidales bacterium]
MKNAQTYRIAVIEPSQIVQQGIKALLKEEEEFEIAYCFDDYQSFKNAVEDINLDIILLNPGLVMFHKQFDVRNFFTEYPDMILVAILYTFFDDETVKSFDGSIDIYDNRGKISKKLKKLLSLKQKDGSNAQDKSGLSMREKEILVAVAKGLTNKEIADKHFISIHTVISHRKNITRKTNIKTVSGLTIYAMINNLLAPEDLQ